MASPGARRTGGVIAAIALSAGFLQAPAASAEEALIEPQMISSGDTDFAMEFDGTRQYGVPSNSSALGGFVDYTVEPGSTPQTRRVRIGARSLLFPWIT